MGRPGSGDGQGACETAYLPQMIEYAQVHRFCVAIRDTGNVVHPRYFGKGFRDGR